MVTLFILLQLANDEEFASIQFEKAFHAKLTKEEDDINLTSIRDNLI